jgi:coproporphyrinogen III oxidase-like Fe-S oxidoreductase
MSQEIRCRIGKRGNQWTAVVFLGSGRVVTLSGPTLGDLMARILDTVAGDEITMEVKS